MVELRVPPHSQEAEQAVLGSCLIDPDALHKVKTLLQPTDFWHEPHRVLYSAFLALGGGNLVQVVDHLRAKDLLDEAKGAHYIAALCSMVPTTANVEAYAEIVELRSRQRQAIELVLKAYDNLHKAETEEDLATIDLELSWAVKPSAANPTDLLHMGDVAEEVYRQQKARPPGTMPGHTTGFLDLDFKTGGLGLGDLIIVAGRPAMGKSAFGVEMAKRSARTTKLPWLFASYEMLIESLAARQISSEALISNHDFRRSRLTDDMWQRAEQAVKRLKAIPLYGPRRQLTLHEVIRYSRHLRNKYGEMGGVLIDYLQIVKQEAKRGQSREQLIAEISQTCKQIAMELECPVVALSQLNRGVEMREDKRPKLGDLRESGAIEQDADMVMFLYRQDYYDEMEHRPVSKPGVAEIIIAKSRNDWTGTVEMRFDRDRVRFDDLHKGA